jgi:hypothetical protein
MPHGVGRKNIPVPQRPKVHWILTKSLVELEVDFKDEKDAMESVLCMTWTVFPAELWGVAL